MRRYCYKEPHIRFSRSGSLRQNAAICSVPLSSVPPPSPSMYSRIYQRFSNSWFPAPNQYALLHSRTGAHANAQLSIKFAPFTLSSVVISSQMMQSCFRACRMDSGAFNVDGSKTNSGKCFQARLRLQSHLWREPNLAAPNNSKIGLDVPEQKFLMVYATRTKKPSHGSVVKNRSITETLLHREIVLQKQNESQSQIFVICPSLRQQGSYCSEFLSKSRSFHGSSHCHS